MAGEQSRYSRRIIALFWLLLVSIVIGTLLYFEQIAILYVLATLSLVLLLLVVGFADLEKVGRENIEGYIGKEGNL
jgi:membrane protein YdbS with pleckstrin-like domain